MASKLYEGRVALVDTETGEMILVGCLIAINGDGATFTISPTSGDEGHAIVRASRGESRLVQRLVETMRRQSPVALE